MSESLVTFIYFSHAVQSFGDKLLMELLRESQNNNRRVNVTGMLLYHDGNFLQALEGRKPDVEEVFRRIAKDSRHAGIISSTMMPLPARQFADWSMGFLPGQSLGDSDRQMLNDYLNRRQEMSEVDNSMARRVLASFRNSVRAN